MLFVTVQFRDCCLNKCMKNELRICEAILKKNNRAMSNKVRQISVVKCRNENAHVYFIV